jgi:hypothetical protein
MPYDDNCLIATIFTAGMIAPLFDLIDVGIARAATPCN